MDRYRILILLVLVSLSGCASQGFQAQNLTPTSITVNTTKSITIHGTAIYYRDLSRPAQAEIVKSPPAKHNPPQKLESVKALASSNVSERVKEKQQFVEQSETEKDEIVDRQKITIPSEKKSESRNKVVNTFSGDNEVIEYQRLDQTKQGKTKRIVLNEVNYTEPFTNGRRRNSHAEANHRGSNKGKVGFWQFLFGKRQPEPKPTVVKVVPKPDAELLDQPKEVLFKHAKTDQLEEGQLDILLALSSQAHTTAIYEVRGTAGYKGETAERIGRERADFIKQALINAGVSRTKIRIMAYDASFPGLRGVVTLRDGEAI